MLRLKILHGKDFLKALDHRNASINKSFFFFFNRVQIFAISKHRHARRVVSEVFSAANFSCLLVSGMFLGLSYAIVG